MNKPVKIILLTICFLCTGFLLWAGYYLYKYKSETNEIENSLFVVPMKSSNSIEWSSFVNAENVRLVSESSTIDIYTNGSEGSTKKIYSMPRSKDLYGGVTVERDENCRVVRIIKSSLHPDYILINKDECE